MNFERLESAGDDEGLVLWITASRTPLATCAASYWLVVYAIVAVAAYFDVPQNFRSVRCLKHWNRFQRAEKFQVPRQTFFSA